MDGITPEKANYIITHYSGMLTEQELEALKHLRHSLKLRELPDSGLRTNIYLRQRWLSNNPEILKQLDGGYVQFTLNCAKRILNKNFEKIYFNLCPVCRKLARTPNAKQCKYCGHDWH
ncbi:MAG: hypothetical protein AAGC65_01900 [Mucilaginibacter sp.]